MGSFKGSAWSSRSFFHWLNPCWVLQPEVMGTYLPGTGMLSSGAWCGPRTPCSWDVPPKFLSTTCGHGTSPFRICAPPTSLDGCSFFNSIVVRLPFNSIFDSSEWPLFHTSAVILMWLCEKASCVYLCWHLDWKPPMFFCYNISELFIFSLWLNIPFYLYSKFWNVFGSISGISILC